MPDYGDDKGFQGSGSGEASTGVGDRDAADRSRDQYNRNKQITETNPYGEDGFFSRVFGIDPSKISYAGNFSSNPGQDLAIRRGIASNQFDKFANPFRDVGQGPGKLRPGVQKAGYQTALGPVMEQYREQPMSEMLARGAFSLFGGGLPGLALSQIGTKEYGIEGTPGFDPNNPRGASGMLGEIGRVFTGGVDPTQAAAKAAATANAISDYFSGKISAPAQVQSVTQQAPAQGFEDAKSQFSTGVSRPEVNMQTYDPEAGQLLDVFSTGVGQFLGEPTLGNPVPSLNNIGLY